MKVYENLYVGEGLEKRKDKILKKISMGKVQLNIYVIVLSKSEKNQLEFYDTSLAVQKIFSFEDTLIVGIAKGYEGAVAVVETITNDIYTKTKDANIRLYILDKQKKNEESRV